MKGIVFCLYDESAASTRIRLTQYIKSLRRKGVQLDINFLLPQQYLKWKYLDYSFPLEKLIVSFFKRFCILLNIRKYDFAILYCELFPFFPAWFEKKLLSIPYLYDVDDAFYKKYQKFNLKYLSNKTLLISKSSFVTLAGNFTLQKYYSYKKSQCIYFPSVDKAINYKRKINYQNNKKFTICWIGSPSTAKYLHIIIKPFLSIAKKNNMRLVIIGGKVPDLPLIEKIELPWSPLVQKKVLHKCDLGIMPLYNGAWENGKCGFKLIQYGLVGLPALASAVGTNNEICGKNSPILCYGQQDWSRKLLRLITNKNIRKRNAKTLFDNIHARYSYYANLTKIIKIIKSLKSNPSHA